MTAKACVKRCFPWYAASGPEADELRQIVAEAVDNHLAPRVEISEEEDEFLLASGFTPQEVGYFKQGIAVEQLLHRQGVDSGTGEEISLDELEAMLASERSRGK